MIREAGLYNDISQAYAALDTNKVVGVMVSPAYSPRVSNAKGICSIGRQAANRLHHHSQSRQDDGFHDSRSVQVRHGSPVRTPSHLAAQSTN